MKPKPYPEEVFGNTIENTDSYKVSHWAMLPPGTSHIHSYLEARAGALHQDICFFGLQQQLKRFFVGEVVDFDQIDRAQGIFAEHFMNPRVFNRDMWTHICNRHHGRLPVSIRAVPEGTVVPQGNALMTIENTDEQCGGAALTNYVETMLMHNWYPTTVATQSREMKKIILKYLVKTGTPELIDFKLHDFGFRGVSCLEQAAIGGSAHLVNFQGTDTMVANRFIRHFYKTLAMPGFSIPAAEHSTITSWGSAREKAAYENILKQYPTGFVAIVIDSYDMFNACAKIFGVELKDQVLARDGVLVLRPDSGEPTETLPRMFEILGERFGYETNAKGYKVLHPKIRSIQGDAIYFHTLDPILAAVTDAKWSADNLAFGSGGGLLQKLDRDTERFALKCSAARIGFEWFDVFKKPVTDPTKGSKKGRLILFKDGNGQYQTRPADNVDVPENHMVEVFRDGQLLVEHTFESVRDRAKIVL